MIEKIYRISSKSVTKFLDLYLIIIYLIITPIFILLPPLNETIFRPILVLLLIFFIPGYVCSLILFPGTQMLQEIERIAISIGLSICIVIFTGFILNYTPFGIRAPAILFSLTGITLLFTVIYTIRRAYWEK